MDRKIRETVRSDTVMPSSFSSPWIRGARHKGLADTSRNISYRIAALMAGRPLRSWLVLDSRAQNFRKRSRRQRTIVSG